MPVGVKQNIFVSCLVGRYQYNKTLNDWPHRKFCIPSILSFALGNTEGLGKQNSLFPLGPEPLSVKYKSTLLLCREKFQNYLGDLGKHGKQLQEKNDQLLEELQGLSTRYSLLTKNK